MSAEFPCWDYMEQIEFCQIIRVACPRLKVTVFTLIVTAVLGNEEWLAVDTFEYIPCHRWYRHKNAHFCFGRRSHVEQFLVITSGYPRNLGILESRNWPEREERMEIFFLWNHSSETRHREFAKPINLLQVCKVINKYLFARQISCSQEIEEFKHSQGVAWHSSGWHYLQ